MFQNSTLKNGLVVLTYSMANVNSTSINILVKSGSRYEGEYENGLSHFLEHMSFKGTKNRSTKKIAEDFDAIGGMFNACTTKEYISYYTKALYEHLPIAFEILADVVINPVFTQEEVTKEYGVICQEIAQTLDDPEDLVYEKLLEVAFGKDHPLGRSILGTTQSIKNFGPKDFYNYINSYFSANNIFVSVAGNIKHEEIVILCNKFLSSPISKSISTFIPAIYTGGSCLLNKDLEHTNLLLGFKSVSYIGLAEFYHARILSLILGGGISSRLFQHIREKLGLSYAVGATTNSYYDTGLFIIYAATAPDKLVFLLDEVITQIKLICNNITTEELDRAKKQIKVNILISEEQTSHKSDLIVKNFALKNKYIPINESLEYIFQTNISDLLNIAIKIFTTTPSLVSIGPNSNTIDYNLIYQKLQNF